MEKIINLDLEQPKSNEFTLGEEHQQDISEKQDLQTGSISSKFKSGQELLKAYESLEKEFTKKCQRIKQLEQNKAESDNALAPQFAGEDWQERVNTFFNQNPNAKNYVEQISEVLSSDKVLACSQNSLEQAYNKVLAQNYKPAQELIKDEEFLTNYVLNNEEIKQKIIKDYLAGVSSYKISPVMLSDGGGCAILPNSKPKTMQEANMLAKYCLK